MFSTIINNLNNNNNRKNMLKYPSLVLLNLIHLHSPYRILYPSFQAGRECFPHFITACLLIPRSSSFPKLSSFHHLAFHRRSSCSRCLTFQGPLSSSTESCGGQDKWSKRYKRNYLVPPESSKQNTSDCN